MANYLSSEFINLITVLKEFSQYTTIDMQTRSYGRFDLVGFIWLYILMCSIIIDAQQFVTFLLSSSECAYCIRRRIFKTATIWQRRRRRWYSQNTSSALWCRVVRTRSASNRFSRICYKKTYESRADVYIILDTATTYNNNSRLVCVCVFVLSI